jgi:alpha-1,6-mannosyltransferase
VVLYSLLPHKELRFIFPALPVLTMCASVILGKLVTPSSSVVVAAAAKGHPTVSGSDRECSPDADSDSSCLETSHSHSGATYNAIQQSLRVRLGWVLVVTVCVIQLGCSAVFLAASRRNYPGGVAMRDLHEVITDQHRGQNQRPGGGTVTMNGAWLCPRVHIDALAATRGVTRFTQLRKPGGQALPVAGQACVVEYSKNESLCDLRGFDFLVTGEPQGGCANRELYFDVVSTVVAFDGRLRLREYLPELSLSALTLPMLVESGVVLAGAIVEEGLDALIYQRPILYVMKRKGGV